MEVSLAPGAPPEQEPVQEGGGGRRRRVRRRTQRGGAAPVGDEGSVAVEKMPPGVSVSVAVKTPVVSVAPAVNQKGGVAPLAAPSLAPPSLAASQPTKVVIAPPKKRPAKLVLIPGQRPTPLAARTAALQKTFKAHKVRVLIDNTAKTQRRRRQTLQAVDAMTPDQLRAAAVGARLSRRETVEKVPIDLLRQMLKDYRMMRGMLV